MDSSDQILSQKEILDEIESLSTNVQSILDLNSNQSRILLQKFKFNVATVVDAFYEATDSKGFLIEHGAAAPSGSLAEECIVCCSSESLIGLECNHMACEECWKAYLREKVENGRSLLECMDFDCKLVIASPELFLSDPTFLASYSKLLVKSFMDENPNMTDCPKCDNCIRRIPLSSGPVVCSCQARFCFACGKHPHTPATCQQALSWEKKCLEYNTPSNQPEKESTKWILGNTKDCPKCLAPIQRTGGCNHMKCITRRCRYEFCWECGEKWLGHTTIFTCDRRPIGSTPRETQHRFVTYYNNFRARTVSTENLADLPSTTCSALIKECREVLTYSHVFGFYMENGEHFKKFEEVRIDLDRATKQLEMMRFNPDNNYECLYAQQCLKVLLDYCEEETARQEQLRRDDVEAARNKEEVQVAHPYLALKIVLVSLLLVLLLAIALFLYFL